MAVRYGRAEIAEVSLLGGESMNQLADNLRETSTQLYTTKGGVSVQKLNKTPETRAVLKRRNDKVHKSLFHKTDAFGPWKPRNKGNGYSDIFVLRPSNSSHHRRLRLVSRLIAGREPTHTHVP